MAFTNVWDTTFPPDTQLANLLGQDLRNFRLDAQQRMSAISGLDANKPGFASDAQPSNWNGVLFFATDTGKIYQFNNPAWTDVTSHFIPTQTAVQASKLTADVTSGGGTVTVHSLAITTGVYGIEWRGWLSAGAATNPNLIASVAGGSLSAGNGRLYTNQTGSSNDSYVFSGGGSSIGISFGGTIGGGGITAVEFVVQGVIRSTGAQNMIFSVSDINAVGPCTVKAGSRVLLF